MLHKWVSLASYCKHWKQCKGTLSLFEPFLLLLRMIILFIDDLVYLILLSLTLSASSSGQILFPIHCVFTVPKKVWCCWIWWLQQWSCMNIHTKHYSLLSNEVIELTDRNIFFCDKSSNLWNSCNFMYNLVNLSFCYVLSRELTGYLIVV